MFYCYLYRDPSRNNEPIYVGKGTGKRAYDHLRRSDHHPFTYRLRKMKRNGIEPTVEFLCKDVDEELAFLCEVEAIDLYGRKDLGKGTLLNRTDGGDGISGQTEETKTKRANSLRGQKRTEEQKARMGKRAPYSEEALDSIRQKAVERRGKTKQKPETVAKRIASLSGIKLPSKKNDARWSSPEARQASSERAKAQWAKRKEQQ